MKDINVRMKIRKAMIILQEYGLRVFIRTVLNKLRDKPALSKASIIKNWYKRHDLDARAVAYFTNYQSQYAAFASARPVHRKNGSRDILFVSHDLSRTGAPIALQGMVHVALNNGDWPVVVSPVDGPLMEEYQDLGVIVIIDKSVLTDPSSLEIAARNFDLVVVNTLVCHRVIAALNNSLPPVLWWIHEGRMTLPHVEVIPQNALSPKIKTYAPSDFCIKSLARVGFVYNFGILACGIPDYASKKACKVREDSVLFLMIGPINSLKGQDILLKAIKTLDSAYYSKTRFVFIGTDYDNAMYNEIAKAAAEFNNICWFDNMPREKLWEWYQKADCLIVPSREDILPLVALEAMMFSVPVICSDQTGVAAYIRQSENGIVFPSKDYIALARHIVFAIENRDIMKDMGRKARKDIYQKYFTMDIFTEKALKAMNEAIQNAKKQRKASGL